MKTPEVVPPQVTNAASSNSVSSSSSSASWVLEEIPTLHSKFPDLEVLTRTIEHVDALLPKLKDEIFNLVKHHTLTTNDYFASSVLAKNMAMAYLYAVNTTRKNFKLQPIDEDSVFKLADETRIRYTAALLASPQW